MLSERIVLDTNCLIMSLSARNQYTDMQILPNVIYIDPHYSFGLIHADEDDNKFVDCAIASNAIFIVTEDRHYNELANIPFPKVEVIGIDDFIKYLRH